MGKEAGQALATLEAYERQGNAFNVLHPVVQMAEVVRSDALQESISLVVPDPKTGPGHLDYYKPTFAKTGGLAPTSYLLQRIANAAGVRMEATEIIPEAKGGLPRNLGITVRVAGYVRQPNGELIGWSKTKEISLEVEADKERRAWIKRWEREHPRTPYDAGVLEQYVRGRLLQIREHLLSLAETKCQSRVIRAVLALPQEIPGDRIGLPFVVPRLVGRPDLADPLLREKAEREAERAMHDLYGPTEVEIVRPAPDKEEKAAEATAPEAGEGKTRRESSAQGEVAAAAPPSEVPSEPKSDPMFEEGVHKGKRWSEVAETDPGYMRAIATESRAKAKRELAESWLAYYHPTLGDPA